MAIPRNLANIAPHVNASSTELVVNDGGADLNFRVEGDTDANTLFVDAGNDRVGVGASSPLGKLDVTAAQNDTSTGAFTSPHLRLAASATTNTTGFTGIAYSSSTLNNNGWTSGVGRIGTDSTTAAFVWRFHNDSATGTERMRITASGDVGIGTTTPAEKLHVDGGTIRVKNVNDTGLQLDLNSSWLANENTTIDFTTAGTTVRGRIQHIQNASQASNQNSDLRFFNTNTSNSFVESFRIGGGNTIYFPQISTTASAANAFLNSGSTPANQLLRSTSSIRYKTDIEDLESSRSDAILNLRPVWYRSIADADNEQWSWYGLIAEEVAEVEPRLVHWTYLDDAYDEVVVNQVDDDGNTVLDENGNTIPLVSHTDEDGNIVFLKDKVLKADAEMVPDGVQYDRLTVLLLDVVKRQNQRIEALEAKVAALEAQ